jgi:sugar/nucleoside kinase (ribokinase family)
MQNYIGLFIGLTTIDIQYIVQKFPEANVKIKSAPPAILIGGPASNAAVAFSKLNGNAWLVSSVGKNPFTEIISEDFRITNVNHIDLSENKHVNPILATVVTSFENGIRNIFTHNPATIISEISPNELLEKIQPQIIMLDGFYPEFSLECAILARERKIPVVLDCGSWKPQYEDLLNFTDIVIASSDFFPPGCNNDEQVINWLQAKKVEYIAISKGEQNIVFSEKGKRGEVIVVKTNVVDTLGAGDILHGSFCFFYLETGNFEWALEKASVIATFSCNFNGTREWLNFTI